MAYENVCGCVCSNVIWVVFLFTVLCFMSVFLCVWMYVFLLLCFLIILLVMCVPVDRLRDFFAPPVRSVDSSCIFSLHSRQPELTSRKWVLCLNYYFLQFYTVIFVTFFFSYSILWRGRLLLNVNTVLFVSYNSLDLFFYFSYVCKYVFDA